jgi:hypothetical protein
MQDCSRVNRDAAGRILSPMRHTFIVFFRSAGEVLVAMKALRDGMVENGIDLGETGRLVFAKTKEGRLVLMFTLMEGKAAKKQCTS